MKVPLEVHYRDVPKTRVVEAFIRENVDKLQKNCSYLSSCRVSIEKSAHRRHTNNPYRIRVDMTVPPGHELVASHEPSDDPCMVDLHAAIRRAFEIAGRQLKGLAERQRGEVKNHPEQVPAGVVVKLFREKGYGFIKTMEGQDLYFHRNSVWADEFDRIEVGTGVQFTESEGDEGPQASTVRIIDKPGVRAAKLEDDLAEPPLGWQKNR